MTRLEKATELSKDWGGIHYPEDILILKQNENISKLDDIVVNILWSAWSAVKFASWLTVNPNDGDFLWGFACSEYVEDNFLLGNYEW